MENMTMEQKMTRELILNEVRELAMKCVEATEEWRLENTRKNCGNFDNSLLAELENSYIYGLKKMAVMFGCISIKDLEKPDSFVKTALGREAW